MIIVLGTRSGKIKFAYGGDRVKELKGFIFDMDGVVVDNHKYHFQAWMEFSQKYKFPIDEQIYRDQYNGKTNADLFRMIFGNISQEQMDAYAHEKEGLYRQLYLAEMKPHKGLLEFLEYLHRRRFKVALGTSAPTANVDFVLDGLFLRKYFHQIVDGSQVLRGKPHPEVYLKCCERLELSPSQCVVFEDSIAGLESGKNAGCTVVGVVTSHEAYELKPYTENLVYDFTEVRSLLGL
jgi:beta-phosphoglucomutase family hydrolase